MKARLAFFNQASHDLASYSFDIFLICIHMENCPAWLGMILPEQSDMHQVDQPSLTCLAMIRLLILMFLVLTLQWKISETIPPIVTVIRYFYE